VGQREVLPVLDFKSALGFVTDRAVSVAVKSAKKADPADSTQRTLRINKRTEAFFNAITDETGLSGQAAMAMCLDAMVLKTMDGSK